MLYMGVRCHIRVLHKVLHMGVRCYIRVLHKVSHSSATYGSLRILRYYINKGILVLTI